MRKGFNCVELAVVLGVLTLGAGLFLSAQGAHGQDYLGGLAQGKKRGEGLKDEVTLRNIHMAMTAYGSSNKEWFPGLTSAGKYQANAYQGKQYGAPANAGNAEEQASGAGCTIVTGNNLAMAILLEEGLVAPKQLVAEGDRNPDMATIEPRNAAHPEQGAVAAHHFSHAMLAYGRPGLKPEWKGNQNQQAVVLASRMNFGAKAGQYSSVYTEIDSGKWRGVVVRNDSSCTTENLPGGEAAGHLKYGAKVFKAEAATASVVGIFGKHTDMANFDATGKTGMLGSAMDGAQEEKK